MRSRPSVAEVETNDSAAQRSERSYHIIEVIFHSFNARPQYKYQNKRTDDYQS